MFSGVDENDSFEKDEAFVNSMFFKFRVRVRFGVCEESVRLGF